METIENLELLEKLLLRIRTHLLALKNLEVEWNDIVFANIEPHVIQMYCLMYKTPLMEPTIQDPCYWTTARLPGAGSIIIKSTTVI